MKGIESTKLQVRLLYTLWRRETRGSEGENESSNSAGSDSTGWSPERRFGYTDVCVFADVSPTNSNNACGKVLTPLWRTSPRRSPNYISETYRYYRCYTGYFLPKRITFLREVFLSPRQQFSPFLCFCRHTATLLAQSPPPSHRQTSHDASGNRGWRWSLCWWCIRHCGYIGFSVCVMASAVWYCTELEPLAKISPRLWLSVQRRSRNKNISLTRGPLPDETELSSLQGNPSFFFFFH